MMIITDVPYYEVMCKCSNLTCMHFNERILLVQFLLRYDDDDNIHQGLGPMSYIKL